MWQKYKIEYGQKRPLWIIPIEVIKQKSEYNEQLKLRYKDITFWRGDEIKLKEDIELKGSMGWWFDLQIKGLLYVDKRNFGFMKVYTELDKILVGDKNKVISRIYKIALKNYTQEEVVKT